MIVCGANARAGGGIVSSGAFKALLAFPDICLFSSSVGYSNIPNAFLQDSLRLGRGGIMW